MSDTAVPAWRWRVVVALLIAETVGSFETAMIYAALSKLIADLGDPVKVGWLVTAYLLIGAGSAALAGRLGDIYGRRRVLLVLLGAAALGSLLSALSLNYPMLLAGRALQGLSGAIMPLTIGLVRESVPPARIGRGVGILISGSSAGTAGGLVLGGLIVDHYSWHAVFIASAGLAIVAALATIAWVPASRRAPGGGSIDWLSGTLFVPAILMILCAVTYGPKWGAFDPATLGFALGGALLLTLWAWVSQRSPEPLFDVRLFRSRAVVVANLITIGLALGALQITLVFSALLQSPRWTLIGLGASATLAGLAKLPANVGSMIAGPLSAWFADRTSLRAALLLGGAMTAAGWASAMVFHGSVAQVAIVLCLVSSGTTIVFAGTHTVLAVATPPDRTSEAVGMLTVIRQTFMGIGSQLIAIALASETVAAPGGQARFPGPGAFMLTFGSVAALTALTTLIAFALPRSTRRAAAAE